MRNTSMMFQLREHSFSNHHPVVMAVLNVTPDSFSDGGRYRHLDAALRHAETLITEGADILDIGGESTRPGAEPVSVQQQLDRVMPVLEALGERFDIPLSIDTSRTEVMHAAVVAGVDLINDVDALQAAGALQLAASAGVAVCLMHKRGQPRNMQHAPAYQNVTLEVKEFLENRRQAANEAGINNNRILLDPGFGFAKTLQHNLQLLRDLSDFQELGCSLLAGLSRKSMLGEITGRSINDRLVGSAILALVAVQNGATVVRVHDVAATRDVLAIWSALQSQIQ